MKNKDKMFNFLVCGTVRNVERTIRDDINRLILSINHYNNLDWYLVESDSSDNTLLVLDDLKEKVLNFNYLSMGSLSQDYPERIDRLIYCRNQYLKYVKANVSKQYDYVIVMDFDGINNKLSREAFWSCWDNNEWDVVTANQKGPYYDIWALKHKLWNPVDCFQQSEFFSNYIGAYSSSIINVFSKQITIPITHEWIEVDSAYGGIAIYKYETLLTAETYSPSEEMGIVCDSINLHKNIIDKGFKIFINPRFINADYTEHTLTHKPGFKNLLFRASLIVLIIFGPKFHSFLRKLKIRLSSK